MSNLFVAVPLGQRQPLRICTDVPLKRCLSYSSSNSSPSNRSSPPSAITPASTGNHQCTFHVLCMHNFESSDPVHLPFQKDEVLIIIQQEHSGWWAAMRPQENRTGWIPSSFVLPLDSRKIAEYPDETPWPHENSNDFPLSAVLNPWVPVSEEYRVLSFQLVTPTDLYKGFFDDRMQNQDYESFFQLSNSEQFLDQGDVCIPPTTGSPSSHMTLRPPLPPSPLLSVSGVSHSINRPASPSLLSHFRPCGIDVPKLPACLATPVGSDALAAELIASMGTGESREVFKSVAASRDHSEIALSRHLGLPASFHLDTA